MAVLLNACVAEDGASGTILNLFLGISEINGEKIFVLRMLQGRNPDWVAKPFFAKYDKDAIWMDELKPAFGENKFFFEDELEWLFNEHVYDDEKDRFE